MEDPGREERSANPTETSPLAMGTPPAPAPFFTVVVPTHRREGPLEEAIRSVLGQTDGELELLVVDDDPAESAARVVARFDDGRLTYLRNDRSPGGSGARNAGAFRGRGRWIAFLDDDDAWEPEKLARQRRRIEEGGPELGLVYTGHVKVETESGRIVSHFRPTHEGRLRRELLYRNLLGGLYSVAVRRDVFLEVGGLDESFPAMQDMEFYVRVAERAEIGCVPDPLVRVRVDGGPRISTDWRKKEQGARLFQAKFREDLRRDPVLRHRAASRVFQFAAAAGDAPTLLRATPWTLAGLWLDPANLPRVARAIYRARRSSPVPAPAPAASEGPRVTFLGDVFLRRPVALEAGLEPPLVINLEAPLTRGGPPAPGKINLRADPENLPASFEEPPLAACLANNHVMDFGAEGLASTLATLEAYGTRAFGAGSEADNAGNPLVLDVAGRRLALLGYVCPSASPVFATAERPGVVPIELDRIRRDLDAARAQGADRLVVHLHWGAEQVGLPKPEDVETARAVIDAGADLVIGHHAHRIQRFERYRGRWIFYGLGNAVFGPHESPAYFDEAGRPGKTHRSLAFEWNRRSLGVRFDLESAEVEVLPLRYDGERLVRAAFSPRRFEGGIRLGRRYERRFRRAFRLAKTRQILARFLAEPKPVRTRHVTGLIRVLRTRTYK